MPDTILPPNASVLEKDIEDAAGKVRIGNIDNPIGKLWNPQTIPTPILPYLAWALSVDTWDNAWPDNIKRQVIAASVDVHRKKGTVGAVKKAITALDIDVELLEWFQNNAIPHTFTVTAWSNYNKDSQGQTKLLPQAYSDLTSSITNVKPVRAHFELMFGSKLPSDVGAGFDSNVTARANTTTEIVPYPSRSNSVAGGKYDSYVPARTSDSIELIPYTSHTTSNVGGMYDPHVPARAEHINEIVPYTNKSGSDVGGGYNSYVAARASDSIELIPYTSHTNSGAGGMYDSHAPGRVSHTNEIIPYANKSGSEVGGGYSSYVTARTQSSVELKPYTSKADTTAGTSYAPVAAIHASSEIELTPYTNITDAGAGIIGSLPVMPRINLSLEF